ncbi:MAG: hypothetical protein ACE5I7_03235 [Candidatus Binatia bacterium]
MGNDTKRAVLAATFERHAEEEGKILEQYRALSEQLGSSSAGMLVNQILTEEEIHHLLLRTMAAWLKERRPAQARAIPRDANRAELLRLTQILQQHERETIDACRSLTTQLGGESEALLGTLLDAMVLDSEKHHRLLGVVRQMLTA